MPSAVLGVQGRSSKVGAVPISTLVLQGPMMGPEADTDEIGSKHLSGSLTA